MKNLQRQVEVAREDLGNLVFETFALVVGEREIVGVVANFERTRLLERLVLGGRRTCDRDQRKRSQRGTDRGYLIASTLERVIAPSDRPLR